MNLKKNYLVGFLRLVIIVAWLSLMPIIYLVWKFLRIPGYKKLLPIFHHGLCVILGIRVTTSGEMCEDRPVLYVSNHISYIDIFILGCLPAYFIAKSEVASWPVMGKLAEFQNTLFFERKRGKAKEQLEVLKTHLKKGNSLTFFPEGTSTDGAHVEPFKSTLFESANLGDRQKRVAIQPVTVAYTHYNGEKIVDQAVRDHYAWYANMKFTPHFLGLMPLKNADAKIHFHPVCYLDEFETRKRCADHCQKLVAQQLSEFVC